MDFEDPADAWYVYVAVVIVTGAFAGIALGIASLPPPDAQAAANTIEAATGSKYATSASYEHNAEIVRIEYETITLENQHGTSHASFAYGTVVPVDGHERLENVTYGQSFEDAYEAELDDPHTDATAAFFQEIEAADTDNTGDEIYADGELIARTIAIEEDSTVGLEAKATNNDDLAADLAAEDDDLDEDEIEIAGDVKLVIHGTADGGSNVHVSGTMLAETIDVDDADGWFATTVTGFTCSVLGWWCEDQPDVQPIDHTAATFDTLENGHVERITLVDGDLEDATDSDADEVELWTGTYALEIAVTGADFEGCEGTIDGSEEWTDICGPDLTLEDFDDPHWHEDRGGVHYVTLVTV